MHEATFENGDPAWPVGTASASGERQATATYCRVPSWSAYPALNRVSLPLAKARTQQGPFPPPELPGFHGTMGPADSRRPRLTFMSSRRTLGSIPSRRVSQVPGQSFGTRCPQPPRQARELLLPIASPTVTGFITSGRMAACISVTRPNRVCFRCGSHLRHGEASTPRSLRTPLPGLHAERAIARWAPFIPRD